MSKGTNESGTCVSCGYYTKTDYLSPKCANCRMMIGYKGDNDNYEPQPESDRWYAPYIPTEAGYYDITYLNINTQDISYGTLYWGDEGWAYSEFDATPLPDHIIIRSFQIKKE